jgi:hypothetical protein
MLDNLRNDAASSPFYEEDTLPPEEIPASLPSRRKKSGKFLGMSPIQRFILAFMLMIAVCALGSMCLLLTNKIGLIF